ncbi:unnamed protein product [Candida verbasci]|uniref:Bacterial surface antigen (D15) domain-containing protein n=1 Tax=Candida verbasci TaxID=1227364 RepID=A0A9W4XDB5_9ASCO|nr:unnamed protein product [Candida verbasci]
MSIPDDDFMDTIKYANPNQTNLTKEEKELQQLQLEKQQQLSKINQQFLTDLFQDNATQPIKIRNVQFVNGQAFRTSFLESQLKPLLSGNIITLQNYLKSVDTINKNLLKIGIVENISCNTHEIKPSFYRAKTMQLIPQFISIPVKKFFAKTGTNIGNGEGDGYIQFQIRNLFDGGENLIFDAVTGTKTKSSYLINYNQPIMNNCNLISENIFITNSRNLDWFQSTLTTRGFVNKIQYNESDSKFSHEFTLENYWKILSNSNSKCFEILQCSGSNYKSSIGYNINYSTLDNVHLPTKGQLFQLGIEYNGLLPKFNKFPYIKTGATSTIAYKLPYFTNSSFLNNFKAGFLYPLKDKSHILDRYFIGGPNDIRAFSLNGIGPKDMNSYIGGDLFFNSGFSIITNLPFEKYKDSSFKIHNFINFGKLTTYEKDENIGTNLLKFADYKGFCVSTGIGILFNHPMARFELNFVLPLIVNERDSVRKGFQYGIGVSFL